MALCLNAEQGTFIRFCARTIKHLADHTNLQRHLHQPNKNKEPLQRAVIKC